MPDQTTPQRHEPAVATFSASARGGGELTLGGRLDCDGVTRSWAALHEALSAARGATLTIDARAVSYCDGSGIGILAGIVSAWRAKGGDARVEGLEPELARLVDLAATERPLERQRPLGFIAGVGAAALATAQALVGIVVFTGEVVLALLSALRAPQSIRWGDATRAFVKAGINALPVVCLLCFLIGAIIAFQTIGPMSQYGAKLQVAQVVGVAIIRELGPLITAVVLTGRSGSAFAAELGTMRVTQEIDALTTFGLEPVRFLVLPRMVAAIVALPLLAAFGDLMGVAGGYAVLAANGFSIGQYVEQLRMILTPTDVLQGLAKALAFAVLVGGIGCYCGLETREGPGAVGDSTTRAVVAGIILIIVADAVLGTVFHVVGL